MPFKILTEMALQILDGNLQVLRTVKQTYDTVVSPELQGYKAEILSSNVPGLAVGTKASRVSVTFNPSEIKDEIVASHGGRRTVSETYWRNIVDNVKLTNYETVVVLQTR